MKKLFLNTAFILLSFLSLAGEPIKYNTPENCKTVIQNTTKTVSMLEKSSGSEMILDLFF